MDSNTDNTPKGTGGTEPIVPPRKPSSVAKWQAIVVVLILAVAALAVAYALKSPSTTKTVSAPTNGVQVNEYSPTATVNQSYTFDLLVTGAFANATVWFGDGTSATFTSANYPAFNGATQLTISHTYMYPGSYYIYYQVNFKNGTSVTDTGSLLPVKTNLNGVVNADQALGLFTVNLSRSSAQVVNNFTNIYTPGSHYSYFIGYTTVQNPAYSVVSQTYMTEINDVVNKSLSGPVNFSNAYYTVKNAAAGLNEVFINTTTGVVNGTTGAVTNTTTTTFIVDIPVFTGAGLYSKVPVSVSQTFTNDEVVPAGFKTLDGSIAYDTVSGELLTNLYQFLVQYNGSSNSSFMAELAAHLPTMSNGGINAHAFSRTVRSLNPTTGLPTGPNVTYTYQPSQVYNFTIRANATWQNGQPVTAWDVYYTLVRTLLFDAGTPGTPGWIEAQALLPGDYYVSNTYYNITTNMTYNNATNTITFYFQNPETPNFVFEILAASGDFVMNANWLIAHGAAITFTPAGFQAYKAQGSASDYNTYVQYHALADGPYMINYIVPGVEVALVANPAFQSPGPWYPKPAISNVYIVYVATYQTGFLNLASKQAQTAAGLPTTIWNQITALQSDHIINIYSLPTLDIFWFNFNAFVNETLLTKEYPGANMPATLFTSLAIRKVFAYTFNYAYYLNYQTGNKVFNTTFASSYAGMLPAGMLGAQSIAQLNSTTTGVPYFNLQIAKEYWNQFLNSSANSVFHITSTGSYNGAPLDIPIMTFSQDPVDEEAVQTWAENLSYVIFGTYSDAKYFPVEPTNFVTLLGNMVQGQNPMPIYELGWSPDYPYPTDYMLPMAYPGNSSTYPGPNDFTPYWFGYNTSNPTRNVTEALVLQKMRDEYVNGSTSTNVNTVITDFQAMNENLVNMTFYVYLYQAYAKQIISTMVPQSIVYHDMENTMIEGLGFMYNYFQYTS